jgi:hypothetical protein
VIDARKTRRPELVAQVDRAAPIRALDHFYEQTSVGVPDDEGIGIGDGPIQPLQAAGVQRHATSQPKAGLGREVLRGVGTNLAAIHPEHHTIDDHRPEGVESGVPRRRRHAGSNEAAGKRFEAEQQPIGVVRDVENERAVGAKGENDARGLEVVCARGGAHDQHDEGGSQEPAHCAYHNGAMDTLLVAFAVAALGQAAPAQPTKVDVVAVAGCLQEPSPGVWTITNASDPVQSNANAPSAKELKSLAKSGKNEFRLDGVTVFDLPGHRGHSVIIKGLLNKTEPISRLNVTSVTMVSAECPAK